MPSATGWRIFRDAPHVLMGAAGYSAPDGRASRSRLSPGRRDRAGRDSFSAQQRRFRRQVSARDAGSGLRVSRLRWRRLAGYFADQRRWTGPAINPQQQSRQHDAAVSQQSQRDVHRCDPEGWPGGRDVRHGRRGRRLQQRRLSGYFVTAVGQSRLFHNTGQGRFVDVTEKAGLGGRMRSALPRCGSITIATDCWICSCAIT